MSKKNDSDSTSISSILNNAGIFLLTILILTLVVMSHFSLGGFILFACKVAQSNILPTEQKCKPYSDNPIDIKPVTSNIFVAKPPKANEYSSQKIEFPYDEVNSKNMLIDTLRTFKESNDSFFLTNYFITIIEHLMCFNYYIMNIFFNSINTFLSESLILVFAPLLLPLLFAFLVICNNLYLIFLWFAKMEWFFKRNRNSPYEGRKPDWINVTILDPISYFIGVGLVIFFFFLFFIACFMAFPLLSFFTVCWCLFTILGYKGVMEDKEVGIFNIITKVFKYHKVTFMTILTFLILLSAFSNLGGLGGIVCLVAVIAMFFGIIPSNIYIPEIPLHLSEMVSNEQAKKTCKVPLNNRKRHSFLYNLLFPQSGGAELVQEIKKIGKKMKG